MNLCDRLSDEYATGVKTFLQVAKNHVDQNGKTRCPCKHCQNAFWKSIYDIETHLYKYGIATTYQRWIFHGEKVSVDYNERNDMSGPNRLNHHETFDVNDDVDDDDEMIELLSDVCGPIPNRDATFETTNVETKHLDELLGEVGKKVVHKI